MSRLRAFMHRRKTMRMRTVSQRRRWIAALVCLNVVLVVLIWLKYSGRIDVSFARIVAHPLPLPEALLIVALVVVLSLWLLPKWQAARSQGLTVENRFDRENEARKTLAQIIGGVFVLAGLYSSLQTFNVQLHTFDLQSHTFDLQREGQITDRFTKAIDQLGAVQSGGVLDKDGKPKINLEVRLGGIYALERIAHDSPKDHWTIMEVLTAYVRENSRTRVQSAEQSAPGTKDHPRETQSQQSPVRADIQAILTVIGRRDITHDSQDRTLDLTRSDLRSTDLRQAHLRGADLSQAHLFSADLRQAHLEGAHLVSADLSQANLSGADLSGAHLDEAHLDGALLEGADLSQAHLRGADLSQAHLGLAQLGGADLNGANLSGAHLSWADLSLAHLEGANLFSADLSQANLEWANLFNADLIQADLDGAHLRGAHLSGAHLRGAHLSGVDLMEVTDLTQRQLNEATGDKTTKLPKGLNRPPTWTP
jgi:uncharacterized protein YjbI with pentapeptide repeats